MSRSQSIDSTPAHPRDALITTPAAGQLELRQNNPQDCSNLIRASVDRATVEISRTIIRLNATFSQQLDQARISASNGIKSAQDSATSTIQIVVQSASIATSSAFSSVRIANLAATSANAALTSATEALNTANLAVTSANVALSSATQALNTVNLALTSALSASTSVNAALATANFALTSALSASNSEVLRLSSSSSSDVARLSLASSSDVSRLSASLSLAEASLAAVRVCAISIVPVFQTAQLMMEQQGGLVISNNPQGPPTFVLSLNAAQIAGIVVGGVVLSILLGMGAGFWIIRMRRSRRSSQLDEKNGASDSTDRPPSPSKGEKKRAPQTLPSSTVKNPFLSPEELASSRIDVLVPNLKVGPEDDMPSTTFQKPLEFETLPVASTEVPRRNFSLPRNKNGPKRLSPQSPGPEGASRTDAVDRMGTTKAGKQAKNNPATTLEDMNADEPILKLYSDKKDIEPAAGISVEVRALASENPFDDVDTIESKAPGEQWRGAGRRHVSPLRRNPVMKIAENDEPVPPLPSSSAELRGVSPLRRNPVFQNSMEEESVPPLPDKRRAVSPLRRNPVVQRPLADDPVPPIPPPPPPPPSPPSMQQQPAKQRAISPLRRNLVVERRFKGPAAPPSPPPPLLSSSPPPVQQLLDEQRAISPLRRILVDERRFEEPAPLSPPLPSPLPPLSPPPPPSPSPPPSPPPVQQLPDEQRAISPLGRNSVVAEHFETDSAPSVPPSPPSPLSPPLPPVVLGDRQQTPPLQFAELDTSSTAHETISPTPSPILEARASFPLESELPMMIHEDSEPPSAFEQITNLPSARESKQSLSTLEASMALLIEIESVISDAGENREASTVRYPTSSQSTHSLSVYSGVDTALQAEEDSEGPEEADEPQVLGVSNDMPEENTEEDGEESEMEEEEVPEADERVTRGRSMIRTSDIIEARLSRLSAVARARVEVKVPELVTEEEARANRELSSAATRAGSLEAAKAPAVVLKSNPLPALLRPAQAQSKAGSGAQFKQAFLMFKSLDLQNPQKAAAATTEVNHRALAGIYVPASLREQAVRNLSKSREPGRGKSRARGSQ